MDIEAEVFGGGAPADGPSTAPADDGLPPEFAAMSADDIARRTRLLDTEVRVLRDEATRLGLEQANLVERVRFFLLPFFVRAFVFRGRPASAHGRWRA
jgi:hypothetical protein